MLNWEELGEINRSRNKRVVTLDIHPVALTIMALFIYIFGFRFVPVIEGIARKLQLNFWLFVTVALLNWPSLLWGITGPKCWVPASILARVWISVFRTACGAWMGRFSFAEQNRVASGWQLPTVAALIFLTLVHERVIIIMYHYTCIPSIDHIPYLQR